MSELDQVLQVRRLLSRRAMLRGMAGVGASAALGPVLAACSPAANATPSPTAPAAPSATAGPTVAPTAEPSPTPPPKPEGELFVYNWADYIGENTVKSFEAKYGVKVTYDFFDSAETLTAKIQTGNSGYDVTFPTSSYIKGYVSQGFIQPLDLSLIPNAVNLGPEWKDPAYDPGNKHSMPYFWWTTGVAYDSAKVKEALTSWSALWDPRWKGKMAMLDDVREVFSVALIRLGYDVNTTDEAKLDEALAMLLEQKPLLRTYTTDDIGVLSTGDVWVMHAWGADVYQVTPERPSVKYFVPEEGGIRGSDTMAVLKGAKHPIAANLFINHMLDAEVSAGNTNLVGYMGPNEAAKAFIDPAILADPAVNPGQALVAKLQEIQDLGADEEKYTSRYTKLRSGA